MEWLNEPASWQRMGDVLTVSVDPGTDFWRETGYGYIRDSGHVYGEVLAGDLDVSVRMRCTLGAQFDQAGVMLRADARTWVMTGVEFFEGRPRLSTVLTLGRSSWMLTDLPEGTDEIELRVSRRGDAVEVRYVVEDGPAALAALVFLPPGREVLAGVMAAAPEGPGFRVTFQDLRITARDWSGDAGDEAAWQDDQAGWSAEEAPGWGPPDGEPSWSPEWPAMAGEDTPDWPESLAADDDEPGWAAAAVDPAGPTAEPALDVPAPDEVAGGESGQPMAAEAAPADDEPADHEDADHEDADHEDADHEAADHEAAAEAGTGDGPGELEPSRAGAAHDEPAPHEPAEPEHPEPDSPTPGDSDGESWSPAPVTGDGTMAGPAGSTGTGVDPAADWDRLAAGTEAAPATRWTVQTDADVSNEWPGPPLRAAMRNGLLGVGPLPRPAAADQADDAATDPGLPQARPADLAGTSPAEAGPSHPEDGPAEPPSPEDDADGPEPDAPGREARGRSKRAAADAAAADEWISLLTADPVEE